MSNKNKQLIINSFNDELTSLKEDYKLYFNIDEFADYILSFIHPEISSLKFILNQLNSPTIPIYHLDVSTIKKMLIVIFSIKDLYTKRQSDLITKSLLDLLKFNLKNREDMVLVKGLIYNFTKIFKDIDTGVDLMNKVYLNDKFKNTIIMLTLLYRVLVWNRNYSYRLNTQSNISKYINNVENNNVINKSILNKFGTNCCNLLDIDEKLIEIFSDSVTP